jgi:hypothetical protein
MNASATIVEIISDNLTATEEADIRQLLAARGYLSTFVFADEVTGTEPT